MVASTTRPLVRSVAWTAAGLALALAVPFLVHLIPANGGPPYGARLLPIFYAVVVLVFRGQAVPALATALVAPLLNRAVTGSPDGPMFATLTVELVVFALLLMVAARWLPRVARFLAPVAYVAAALVANLVLGPEAFSFGAIVDVVQTSWAGLLVLIALGAIVGAAAGTRRRSSGV
ncbi:MAG: hypothetical protein R6W77_04900 [Trueperaceae bacterium]